MPCTVEMSRCDGQAHGGCQAGCSIYWKEAWLKRIPSGESALDRMAGPAPRCTLATLTAATRRPRDPTALGEGRYALSGDRVAAGGAGADLALGRQAVP
jgi:hypothetical protein